MKELIERLEGLSEAMRGGKFVPDERQIKALKAWQKEYGNNWKQELQDAWMTGRYRGFKDSAVLQQMRNSGGTEWLYSKDANRIIPKLKRGDSVIADFFAEVEKGLGESVIRDLLGKKTVKVDGNSAKMMFKGKNINGEPVAGSIVVEYSPDAKKKTHIRINIPGVAKKNIAVGSLALAAMKVTRYLNEAYYGY